MSNNQTVDIGGESDDQEDIDNVLLELNSVINKKEYFTPHTWRDKLYNIYFFTLFFFQAIHYQPNRIIIHYSKAGICQLQLYEKIAMLMTADFVLILMFQISFLLEAHLACFWHTEKYRYEYLRAQTSAHYRY